MKNKIWLAGLLTAAAVLVAAFGVSTPAFASWGGCPDTKLCTYWDSNGNGAVYYYTYPGDQRCINIGAPWDNNISSVWNRTGLSPYDGHAVTMYRDHNCANGFFSYTWSAGDGDTVCSLYCFPDAYSSLRFCVSTNSGC